MTRSGEFDMIARWLAPLAGDGAFGLTDDAAVLPKLSHGEAWTITKDTMVAGVHFFPDDDPDLIARKLMRVNLSDLAAMGARPVGYLLSLSLSPDQDDAWTESFCSGLRRDQEAFDVSLFGGDTTSTPGPLTMSLTAFGAVGRGAELRRNGARPGDAVWVSGTIGDAALGLALLKEEVAEPPSDGGLLIARYWLPQPRIALGRSLAGRATACLDVSDGLLGDLDHIAGHSGVGIEIEADAVPLSAPARRLVRRDAAWGGIALTGGDDYELAFTLPEGQTPPESEVRLTRIGRVLDGEGVTVVRDGRLVEVKGRGWRHF
jgi:thiamine-monophosphate kinase